MNVDKVEVELELDEETIMTIDAMAEEQNTTRDEIVEQLLRDYLDSL